MMADKPLRCALYIRVSTAEQMVHGKSLEAQREYLEQYAKEQNMTVAGVYADEGKTARKELKKRRAIHALLEDVKAGRIDRILFWRLDRWFRNLSDFYKVQDILDEYGVSWMSVSEPGINMETRDGRLQLNVVLSIGQNEVDTTSERIKFVNESSIRQGKLIFGEANMGFGYKPGMVEGVKRMIKDPETEEAANACFRHLLKHQNKSDTVKYMQAHYNPDFSYSMLRTMTTSEFYKGTYRSIPYCPAYVTEEEWNTIQSLSVKNIKRTPSGRIYLFTGLMRCPVCGQKLAGTGCTSVVNRSTGEKRTYCYYRCNRAAIDHVCRNRRRMSQNLIEKYLLDHLENEYNQYQIRYAEIRKQIQKTKKSQPPEKLQKELDRLNLLFQKGRIGWNYYNEEYARIEEDLTELREPPPEPEGDFSDLETALRSDFRSMYAKLTPENRRSFWRSIVKEIYLKEDYTVHYIDFLPSVLY